MERDQTIQRAANLWLNGVSKNTIKRRLQFARELNLRKPISEEWFKSFLKDNKIKEVRKRKSSQVNMHFRQNYVVQNYIIDFGFPSVKIGIEVDESSHKNRKLKDGLRTLYLNKLGWYIFRVNYRDDLNARLMCEFIKKCKILVYFRKHLIIKKKRKRRKKGESKLKMDFLSGEKFVDFVDGFPQYEYLDMLDVYYDSQK